MPIHQTKLMIANPQATGMFNPQTPVPSTSRTVIDSSSSITINPDKARPTNHQSGVLRVCTIALIFSVIDPMVWPGAITGARVG